MALCLIELSSQKLTGKTRQHNNHFKVKASFGFGVKDESVDFTA
jgi:hypothetical protein